MCIGRSFKVSRKSCFSHVLGWDCLLMMAMETRTRAKGDVVVFMASMFLCRFLLFGMCVMLWISLDAG